MLLLHPLSLHMPLPLERDVTNILVPTGYSTRCSLVLNYHAESFCSITYASAWMLAICASCTAVVFQEAQGFTPTTSQSRLVYDFKKEQDEHKCQLEQQSNVVEEASMRPNAGTPSEPPVVEQSGAPQTNVRVAVAPKILSCVKKDSPSPDRHDQVLIVSCAFYKQLKLFLWQGLLLAVRQVRVITLVLQHAISDITYLIVTSTL